MAGGAVAGGATLVSSFGAGAADFGFFGVLFLLPGDFAASCCYERQRSVRSSKMKTEKSTFR